MARPNPAQSAIALAYQTGDLAPRVVAKGRGLIAEQIIERAREHGVYVHESRELLALLMQVDLDASIPPALYRAVAELLAWLYHLETSRRSDNPVSLANIPALTLPPPETPEQTN